MAISNKDWTIHKKWLSAQGLYLDQECPRMLLEYPFHVGPGVSLGGRGFGYKRKGGKIIAKDHRHGVIVKAGAYIHPHVTIDRGSWRDTYVGNNSMLNAFSFLGHNVRLGRGVLVGVKASISGSTVLGDEVVIWSHAYVAQHCVIGDRAIVGAFSHVLKGTEIGPEEVWFGNPATRIRMRGPQDKI